MSILQDEPVASEAPALEVPISRIQRGEIYRFDLGSRPVILFWAADKLVLASEICPHIGGPPERGQARRRRLRAAMSLARVQVRHAYRRVPGEPQ